MHPYKASLLEGGRFPLSGGNGRRPKGVGRTAEGGGGRTHPTAPFRPTHSCRGRPLCRPWAGRRLCPCGRGKPLPYGIARNGAVPPKSPLLKGGRFPLSGGNGRRPKGVGGPEGGGGLQPGAARRAAGPYGAAVVGRGRRGNPFPRNFCKNLMRISQFRGMIMMYVPAEGCPSLPL